MSAAADPDTIVELFAGFDPVAVRRMFGGAGVFADGLMIALVADGAIFLKTDEQGIAAFEREGLEPFSYPSKNGVRTLKSYWRMPERLYDEPEALGDWANRAMEAARRAAKPARVKKSSGSRKSSRKRS